MCSNECGEGSPQNWCGQYRRGDQGQAMRCMQHTIYGQACALEGCAPSEDNSYYYCNTNEARLYEKGHNSWWDYCSLQGFNTTNPALMSVLSVERITTGAIQTLLIALPGTIAPHQVQLSR